MPSPLKRRNTLISSLVTRNGIDPVPESAEVTKAVIVVTSAVITSVAAEDVVEIKDSSANTPKLMIKASKRRDKSRNQEVIKTEEEVREVEDAVTTGITIWVKTV